MGLPMINLDRGVCTNCLNCRAVCPTKKVGDYLGMEPDRCILGALMVGYPDEQVRHRLPRKPRPVRWI